MKLDIEEKSCSTENATKFEENENQSSLHHLGRTSVLKSAFFLVFLFFSVDIPLHS